MNIILVLSFICFVVAALNVPAGRINLVALGLALYVAATLFVGRF